MKSANAITTDEQHSRHKGDEPPLSAAQRGSRHHAFGGATKVIEASRSPGHRAFRFSRKLLGNSIFWRGHSGYSASIGLDRVGVGRKASPGQGSIIARLCTYPRPRSLGFVQSA